MGLMVLEESHTHPILVWGLYKYMRVQYGADISPCYRLVPHHCVKVFRKPDRTNVGRQPVDGLGD